MLKQGTVEGLRYMILMFNCFYRLRFDCILKHCFVSHNIQIFLLPANWICGDGEPGKGEAPQNSDECCFMCQSEEDVWVRGWRWRYGGQEEDVKNNLLHADKENNLLQK